MENNQTQYEFSEEQIKAVTSLVMRDDEIMHALKRVIEDVRILISNVISALNPAIDSLINSLNPFFPEYQRLVNLGAENNPRIAFLAYHAKKQRIRNKNLKKLFNIGYRIDIQNHGKSTFLDEVIKNKRESQKN